MHEWGYEEREDLCQFSEHCAERRRCKNELSGLVELS